MFKVKNKYSMTSFWCFYYRLWPQLAYQCKISPFNFEQVFISRAWKKSHNVLPKRHICSVIKVARPISFTDLSLHLIEINYEHMTILWTHYEHIISICFMFALGIPSVLSSIPRIIRSAISSLFPRDLIFALSNRKPIYLNHWNSETNW